MELQEQPLWQIIILVICGLAAIVSILSQFIIAGMIRRLNRHGDKLEDHQDRIISMEANYKNGVVTAQKSFDDIEEGIAEIKAGQKDQVIESKKQAIEIQIVDKRLTDFIIDYYKNVKKS